MNYENIRRANPWKDIADTWLKEMKKEQLGFQYIYKDDINAVSQYRPKSDDVKLILDIPPQPFVGAPEASIWLLMNNPGGGGEWNHCDFICGSKAFSKEDDRNNVANDADENLGKRQELYAQQLKLSGEDGHQFILLDPTFRTAKNSSRAKAKNIYTWYIAQFLPSTNVFKSFLDENDPIKVCRFFSKNLFVLDYFPYHSKKFGRDVPTVKHAEFWRIAVRAALADESKILVVKSSFIRDVIRNDSTLAHLYKNAVFEHRIVQPDGERVWLSENNLSIPIPHGLLDKYIVRT